MVVKVIGRFSFPLYGWEEGEGWTAQMLLVLCRGPDENAFEKVKHINVAFQYSLQIPTSVVTKDITPYIPPQISLSPVLCPQYPLLNQVSLHAHSKLFYSEHPTYGYMSMSVHDN